MLFFEIKDFNFYLFALAKNGSGGKGWEG
jgi:hypothetical protein